MDKVKIAISCTGRTLEDKMDFRFGRAACFLIVESDTMESTVLDNSATIAPSGAGIAAAQLVIDQQVDAIITGQIGPNALDILKNTDILLFQGVPGTAYENMVAYHQHKLKKIDGSGPAHAGL